MIKVLRMDGAYESHESATGAVVSSSGHLEVYITNNDQWALAIYAPGTWASVVRS